MTSPKKTAQSDMTFEEAFERLNRLVAQLEEEPVALEEALRKYEEAMGLIRKCGSLLDTAEARIERLTREADGTFRTDAVE